MVKSSLIPLCILILLLVSFTIESTFQPALAAMEYAVINLKWLHQHALTHRQWKLT